MRYVLAFGTTGCAAPFMAGYIFFFNLTGPSSAP